MVYKLIYSEAPELFIYILSYEFNSFHRIQMPPPPSPTQKFRFLNNFNHYFLRLLDVKFRNLLKTIDAEKTAL